MHKAVEFVLTVLLLTVSVFTLMGVVYGFKPGLLCTQATSCSNRGAGFEWGLLAGYVLVGAMIGSVITLPLVIYIGVSELKRLKRSETK